MGDKRETLAHIYNLMSQRGVTIEEVRAYVEAETPDIVSPPRSADVSGISADFDVVCVVDGKKVRVPFAERAEHKVIGIFPFKDEPIYIELEEVPGKKHTDKDVDEDRLPDEPFCERVSMVKDELNKCLEALGSPILEGLYLADNSEYMPGCGWIVRFYADESGIGSEYYGGNVTAKLRYVGVMGRCPLLRSSSEPDLGWVLFILAISTLSIILYNACS